MWYQSWQAGYHDILKRGFPKPDDDRRILAELRSPNVGDFLHGGSGAVPFLVGNRAREAFERSGLTGFEFGPVLVAKIATKGVRRGGSRAGEPEDAILKSRGIPLDCTPSLHAVRVTATTEVLPEYESGRTASGSVSPFRLTPESLTSDLWRPSYRGKVFSAWTFCSERFRSACETMGSPDIAFEGFRSFMDHYREGLRSDGRG